MKPQVSFVQKVFPTGALQPFISEYVFRALTVPAPHTVVKAMPLRVTGSIDFFLGDPFETTNCHTEEMISFSRCTIRGPRTHKKYTIAIKGYFASFTIKFRPTGLYRLLGIPTAIFCNEAIDGQLVYTGLFQEITERLMACRNINDCIKTAEPYLLQLLQKQKKLYSSAAIDQMTKLIFKDKAPGNITDFIEKVALSERQLERNFIKEVGTGPKLYSNMVRFENLLRHKMNSPEKNWTTLAYEFNYYDQMHLVKSFQRFLGTNPRDFLPANFAL